MSALVEQLVYEDAWPGLYGESWKGVICDEAFAHPAKFSRALIRKIYDHVTEEGWATKGSTVIDPFGGVALGGLDAMRHGLNFVGVELEEKFFNLGNKNIELWNERYSRLPNWGTARLLNGDSRKLAEVLSTSMELSVSSPPYVLARQNTTKVPPTLGHIYGEEEQERIAALSDHRYGESPGQLGAMREGDHAVAIASPPYATTSNQGGDQATHPGMKWRNGERADRGVVKRDNFKGVNYGSTEGQLGAMPEGSLCVSSPPFEATDTKPTRMGAGSPSRSSGDGAGRNKGDYVYGESEGNLGNMRGGFEAAISSPPYEGTAVAIKDGAADRQMAALQKAVKEGRVSGRESLRVARLGKNTPNGNLSTTGGNYNQHNENNLGNQSGETFWSASRTILEQLHSVLSPNAHAVFVVKAFVRNKQIVDFPMQWAQLCEAVGFRLLHHHRASLVEHSGTQGGFHEDKEIRVERKSFFRRLAEAKGSPRIDHESVLCFEKL